MAMSANIKRLLTALAFFFWTAFVIAAYYLIQKPKVLLGIDGLAATIWVLIVWLLLVINAVGIGTSLISFLPNLTIQPVERFIIGTGIGLGLLGLGGFLVGIVGWTHPALLIGVQIMILLLLWWNKTLQAVWGDLLSFVSIWRDAMINTPRWLKIVVACALLIVFLFALAPPAEAFDALFYHLVGPERLLNGQGMQPSSVPHFWFPALPEGLFLWAQGIGAVRSTQLLHFTWAIITILLVWYWAGNLWDHNAAQKTLVIVLSMPSLYWLASWAYTDFALTFYGLAAIYAIYKAFVGQEKHPQMGWIIIAGFAAGMAMAVKYTSFLVPISVVLLTIWWGRNILGSTKTILVFSLIALAVAVPWYLRSWIVMGNPIYPFVFGGAYWDSFRASWYAESGTGIGWNLKEIILIPISATFGYRDVSFYGGRFGPLYLVLAPFTIYTFLASKEYAREQRMTLLAIKIFTLLSMLFWILGIIYSSALWQTRLLFPALIPFSIPTALGLMAVKKLDTPKLSISYIINFVVIAVVVITVIDAGISVLIRNPVAYAVGYETRQAYLAKVQPSYAMAMQLLEDTPEDARIYFLFEPRSYGAPREVHIDAILDNFSHDLYIFQDVEDVLEYWRSEGYTHVLVYRRGVDFLIKNRSSFFTSEYQAALEQLIQDHLVLIDRTGDGAYELYSIPFE